LHELPLGSIKLKMNNIQLQNECWKACYQTGDLIFVKECIVKGLDINARAETSGATPLDASIYGNHKHIFDFLISEGANVNAIGYADYTIAMAAANQGKSEMLKILLDKGADPNLASPKTGETPLHAAAAKGFVNGTLECVKLLLEAGANPNVKSKSGIPTETYYRDIKVIGETPLHLAAAYGSKEMIELLLKYNADPSIKDDRDESPLTWYSRHQRIDQHIKLERDSRDLLLYGKWKI